MTLFRQHLCVSLTSLQCIRVRNQTSICFKALVYCITLSKYKFKCPSNTQRIINQQNETSENDIAFIEHLGLCTFLCTTPFSFSILLLINIKPILFSYISIRFSTLTPHFSHSPYLYTLKPAVREIIHISY